MNILISDIFNRKSFDIYNLVKRKFPSATLILTTDKITALKKLNGAFLYGKEIHQLRKTQYEFLLDITALLEKFDDEKIIYIPIEEDTTHLFLNYTYQKQCRNFSFLLPSKSSFELSRNKQDLAAYCDKHHLPSPKQYRTRDELAKIEPSRNIIIKPKIGSGSQGIIRTRVKDLNVSDLNFDENIVQDLLPNSREIVGVFMLFHEGSLQAFYCHKRLRTSPPSGGVTVLSKFFHDDRAVEIAEKVLQKLQWNGLAMVELIADDENHSYKIIEINPRCWGSILLSEFSGANLLERYIRLSCGMAIENEKELNANASIRWIFPFDILNLITGKLSLSDFFSPWKNTCFINWTYSNKMSAIIFHFLLVFNRKNFIKLLSKLHGTAS